MYDPRKVVIFGCSGHAKVVVDILESNEDYKLIGFIDRFIPENTNVLDYKVIGTESFLPKLMKKYKFNKGVIGIGDNFIRSKVVNFIKKIAPDFKFINCIHNSAKLSKYCDFGVGNVVMPGVSINASSIISDHCILNTNSSLDHDCRMKSYSCLAPNSAVGGNCIIGKYSYVGIGASIFHGVEIDENCIVGGGSVLNNNTKSNSTYYGIPARRVSSRKLGDTYL